MPENSKIPKTNPLNIVQKFFEDWWKAADPNDAAEAFVSLWCRSAYFAGYEKAKEIYTRYP